MKLFKRRKCDEIIARLDKDFQSNHKQELIQEIGANDQDFISTGRYGTTKRVSVLIHVHYDYISHLINIILESLERDYPNLSPIKCKQHLIAIIEREYDKLANKVPGWLIQSQLPDPTMFKLFEDGVQKKKEEAISSLDNNCHLWEERWKHKVREHRRKTVKKAVFYTIAAILIPVLGWFVPKWISGNNFKVLPVDPNSGRTPLNVRTRERVEKLKEFIIKEKIEPWLFMEIIDFRVTKADGSLIAYSGIKYSGSPILVFWSKDYIDPFLKEGIQKVLDETGQECRENNLKAEEPLKEAGALLTGLIWNVYNRMAEVDAKLRKNSTSKESVNKKDIKDRVESMDKYLREQLLAALELYSK